MKTLKARLMLTYSLVALFGIVAVLFSANFLVDSQFKKLVYARMTQEQSQYLVAIPRAYSQVGWNQDTLASLGMDALAKGYVLKLADASGIVIWDVRTHNDGLCNAMLQHMALNMNARYPGWSGSYREETFPVSYGFNSQGAATFGLYGPLFFNDSELDFLKTLNVWVLVIGILALALSLLLGALMARWISHPILRVTQTAHQFRLGNWNSSLLVKSGIAEIVDLSGSIEALGENLQNQEQLRRRLTADVSHELRSPLSILQGRLEALIDGVWEIDGAQLEFIRQEVLRLTRLVGQLENLTQIESHQTLNRPDRLSVRPFLNSLLDPFLAEAQAHHLSLTTDAADFEFVADEDKTRQILFNLVSNAMKYTEGGWIKVSAKQESDVVWFVVEDNGMGIAESDLPFIFERFYRADVSRTRATGGAGLGLAIAKSLAESQGGTLSVESHEGKGSRFSLKLPKLQT